MRMRTDGLLVDEGERVHLCAHGLYQDIAEVAPLLKLLRQGVLLEDKFKPVLPILFEILDEPLYEIVVGRLSLPPAVGAVAEESGEVVMIAKPTERLRALVRAMATINCND
jgi:hypothetical protein